MITLLCLWPSPQSLVMQKWRGRFPAFSFASQSSDESCTSTSLVIWGSAQTNIHPSFSIHSSIQPTSWNQGKGFSPIFPSKNGKKRQHENVTTRKQKEKATGHHPVLKFSVAAGILLSMGKWRQQLPRIVYDSIYLSKLALWVLVKEQSNLNHLQRKEQGEQRLPLLTPVSSCNSSLNLGDDDLIFWQSPTWERYGLVYTSFWLLWEGSKPAMDGDWVFCVNRFNMDKSWCRNRRKKSKQPEEG